MKSKVPAEIEATCRGCNKQFMAKRAWSKIGYREWCDECTSKKLYRKNFNMGKKFV